MKYYITQVGREFIAEGKATGSDPLATSRKVHKFDQKRRDVEAGDAADDEAARGRARAIRTHDADVAAGGSGGIGGDPRQWVQMGRRPSAVRAREKPAAERGEQVERIRQRVVDRSGGAGDATDPHDSNVSQSSPRHQAKLKWGQGMWKETGKRAGEGREGTGRSLPLRRPGSGRASVDPTGGRRMGGGTGTTQERQGRRFWSNQPDVKKWKRS